MNKYKLVLSLLLVITLCQPVYSQALRPRQIEKSFAKAIALAYPACVRIWGFDTLKKNQTSAQFSGVVVSQQGHILTVAHAIEPGFIYKVRFPDGKEVIAQGKGKIAIPQKEGDPDMALVKITTPGKWPYAEMAYSDQLLVNALCLSISYPETLNQLFPTVRTGRILSKLSDKGYLISTCKMEPGDSGGPLFDIMGRVIGLHSYVEPDERFNYEVPVNLYRQYWAALNEIKNHTVLPLKLDSTALSGRNMPYSTYPAMVNLDSAFMRYQGKWEKKCFTMASHVKGQLKNIIATAFLVSGSNGREVYLVSKSSAVGDSVQVSLPDGSKVQARVLTRDKQNDLVLLQLPVPLKYGIKLQLASLRDTSDFSSLAKFLVSPLPAKAAKISNLGSMEFSLIRKYSVGYLGAAANFIDGKVTLTRINPNSPAAQIKLERGDQINRLNGKTITQPADYSRELSRYDPGDTVSIEGLSNGITFHKSVELQNMPFRANHPADQFYGGKSLRSDGFNCVFVHDALITPEQCGGPVFDINGHFQGINIARFSRTATVCLPKHIVLGFISDYFQNEDNRPATAL